MSITDSTPEVSEISGFLSAVKRRWWVAFLVAALAAGAATLFAQRQATEYTSYATVLVNPLGVEPTKALSSEAVDLEVEAELASSYVVASAAVELLGDMTGVVDDADPARGRGLPPSSTRQRAGPPGSSRQRLGLLFPPPIRAIGPPTLSRVVAAHYTRWRDAWR